MGIDVVYNLGIIGYGSMANSHREILENSNLRIKLKAIYDINEERMYLAQKQGYKTYSSKEELLSDKDIDIVLVATTNESHKIIAIDAIKAGKHVLCEKPVALNSEELNQMILTAEVHNKVFTVNQNRRFNRDFINMWRTIDSGKIGKPYIIESRVEGSRGIPVGWRTNKHQGGGMMLDWGVHLIDQILYMINDKITNVFCIMHSINYLEVDDNFSLTLTFESGLVVRIEVATNNFIKRPRFYVFGTEGTMVINEWDGCGTVIRKIADDNQWESEITKVKAGPTKTMAPRNAETVEEIILKEPTDVNDSLEPVYEQLIDAIEGKDLVIKPEETMRVMKVMEAAFESAKKGMALKVEI